MEESNDLTIDTDLGASTLKLSECDDHISPSASDAVVISASSTCPG